MKKLSAALILLAMVTICTTSFGYILVYKMSMTLNGANNDTGANAIIPLKGYLIIDPNVPAEANLIIFGKDANTPRRQKVYIEIRTESITLDLRNQGDIYQSLKIVIDNDNFELTSLMRGRLIRYNVGPLAGYQEIPLILNGAACVFGGEILGAGNTIRDITGTAGISMTLWPPPTRWANGKNDEIAQKTQEEVVAEAVASLDILGFNPLNE
jgi:hypothetical protein